MATPIQTYYIPLRENDLVADGTGVDGSFEIINGAADESDIQSITTISIAASGTQIVYDHQEDGYEASLSDPQQSTTEIWGDGDASNGSAPGFASDTFNGGDVIILNNVVPTPRGNSILFDGGDIVAPTFPIAMTRAAFPTASGTQQFFSGAVEVFDTDSYGDSFIAPVGEDTADTSGTNPFQYSGVHVLASEANTPVYLNGNLETTLTNAGDTVVLRVDEGDNITTFGPGNAAPGKPVQATLVTGDIGSTFEMRWYALKPEDAAFNDYYTPVFTGEQSQDSNAENNRGPTRVWVHNPNDSAITIQVSVAGNPNFQTFSVPAGDSVLSGILQDDSGARFFTPNGENFYALTQTDTTGNGQINDWGHPLIAANELTSQGVIGLGFGNTPQITTGGNSGDNRSVVWVAAVEDNTTVNIDFDGDGTIDAIRSLDTLESITIFDDDSFIETGDPGNAEDDQDMSGAIITATNSTGDPVDIAIAYGQDSQASGTGTNSLDFGTVVPPLPTLEASKSAELAIDVDNDGEFDPGDTIEWTISILNFGRVDIPAGGYSIVDFNDPVFDETTYVEDSTVYTFENNGTQTAAVADLAGTGNAAFPLQPPDGFTNTDEISASADTNSAGEVQTLTFRTVIDDFGDLAGGVVDVTNTGELRFGDDTDDFTATVPIPYQAAIDVEKATNGEDADDPTGPSVIPGSTVTWTYEVSIPEPEASEPNNTFLKDIELNDSDAAVDPVRVREGESDDGDDLLEPGEIWFYEATGTAITGQYENTADVIGTPSYADGTTVEGVEKPTDEDPSHYIGEIQPDPGIEIEKFTNGVDSDSDDTVPEIEPDETVTWTYEVTNTGNVSFNEDQIRVTDDQEGEITNIIDMGDGNDTLDPGETWIYEASAVAEDLTTVLDFENDAAGNPLAAGTLITNQYASAGLTISATDFGAMIFDSENPTGGDVDLITADFGNVLIISEDGNSGEPDDNDAGGSLTFDFDEPVRVESLIVQDTEESGGTIEKFAEAGDNAPVSSTTIPTMDDGVRHEVVLDDELASRVVVNFAGSASLVELVYTELYRNMAKVVIEDTPVEDSDDSGYTNPVDPDSGSEIVMPPPLTNEPCYDPISVIPTLTVPGTPGDDDLDGTNEAEFFTAGAGSDIEEGFGGADVFLMSEGRDFIAGGGGNDIALFCGEIADYAGLTYDGDSTYVVIDLNPANGDSGRDRIGGVEIFEFEDAIMDATTGEITLKSDLGGGGSGTDLSFTPQTPLPADEILGTDGSDELFGTNLAELFDTGAGADRDIGRGGDDVFIMGPGTDVIGGGGGTDTAIFDGVSTDYTIDKTPNGKAFLVTDNNPSDGDTGANDRLSGVEFFEFKDTIIETATIVV